MELSIVQKIGQIKKMKVQICKIKYNTISQVNIISINGGFTYALTSLLPTKE